MYNKCLEYLLSNDSDDVMSESGIEFRKFIHPVVIRVGKLLGPDKYVLIKREQERIIHSRFHLCSSYLWQKSSMESSYPLSCYRRWCW